MTLNVPSHLPPRRRLVRPPWGQLPLQRDGARATGSKSARRFRMRLTCRLWLGRPHRGAAHQARPDDPRCRHSRLAITIDKRFVRRPDGKVARSYQPQADDLHLTHWLLGGRYRHWLGATQWRECVATSRAACGARGLLCVGSGGQGRSLERLFPARSGRRAIRRQRQQAASGRPCSAAPRADRFFGPPLERKQG